MSRAISAIEIENNKQRREVIKMAFHYKLGLSLVNPSTELELTAYQQEIEKAVASYNSKQQRAVNHKKLFLLKVNPKELIVSLESEVALTAPAKALKTFSQIIVEELPDVASKMLYHNHIFRSFPIVDELQIEQSRIESVTAEISDQKLLEAMVRLCMNPLENRSIQEKDAL